MKKILLNGLHYEKQGAGISKYNQMLIKYFIDGNYDVDILMRKDTIKEFESKKLISINKDILGSKDRILQEQIKSNSFYKKYDLVHFPDYGTPCFYQGIKVATIHDMAMHTMRDKYTFMQNVTKNILLKHTVNNAELLICVSEFAKNELLKYYPKVENKTIVIYEGIEIPNFKIQDFEYELKILQKFGLNQEKYLLYVGTIAPHKNILRLVRAFSKVCKEFPDYKLVIAGKKGWMYQEVFLEVEKLNLERNIIFTDFIMDEDLEVLYKNSKLFVTVSLYEGFGFPPLEAMIRKVPVLVSEIDVFKETCKEAVFYCNPIEIEDIADKIIYVLKNNEIRERMIEKGYDRAQFFDWKKTAEETYESYKRLLD